MSGTPAEEAAPVSGGPVIADWIRKIVEDERARDAVRARNDAITARQAELVRVNGRQLLDDLRVAAARDVLDFQREFEGDQSRRIELENGDAQGGFVVRKPATPAVSLTLTPHLETATVVCHYRFTPGNDRPPREERFELFLVVSDGVPVLVKHHKTGQTFATADALSEFLLVPVLTGRPR